MVTLSRTVLRDSPATKPVSPVRAPFDRPSSGIGFFTAPEVMFTTPPNLRSIIASTTARMRRIGVIMVASTAYVHARRSHQRKWRGGGPPALLTRMSELGQAVGAAARPA